MYIHTPSVCVDASWRDERCGDKTINTKQRNNVANTGRFGLEIPTAVNTRAKHLQYASQHTSTPDCRILRKKPHPGGNIFGFEKIITGCGIM